MGRGRRRRAPRARVPAAATVAAESQAGARAAADRSLACAGWGSLSIDREGSGDYDRSVRVRIVAALLVIAAASGCPREVQEPEPGEATPCDSLAGCNGGQSCGGFPLRACVDGLCEESPSLVIPCLDGG